MPTLRVVRSIAELREQIAAIKRAGRTIGFVPTMGFLHQGHLSLMELAGRHADVVVTSIFVNPTQFNNREDFEKYPIDIERDTQLLRTTPTQILFLPTPELMYGERFQSWVHLDQLPKDHCGASRPGHFQGVTTVVSILFNLVQPDVAVFGEKDFQQLRVIEQMVSDLKFPVRILRGPLVRESDGLAMSSRNARLSPAGRQTATALYQALCTGQAMYNGGARDAAQIRAAVLTNLAKCSAFTPDYVNVIEESTLELPTRVEGRGRILAAAYIEGVRLIDNVALG